VKTSLEGSRDNFIPKRVFQNIAMSSLTVMNQNCNRKLRYLSCRKGIGEVTGIAGY